MTAGSVLARVRPAVRGVRALRGATPDLPTATALGAALLAGYTGMFGAALAGAPWVFLLLVVGSHLLDLAADRVTKLAVVLSRGELGLTSRGLLRDLVLVLLAARVSWPAHDLAAVAVGTVAVAMARIGCLMLLLPLTRLGTPAVEVRNIDLGGLRLPRPLPPRLLERSPELLHQLGVLPPALGAISAGIGSARPFLVTVVLVLVAAAGAALAVVRRLLHFRGRLQGSALLKAVNQRVAALRPEVVLYFSGSEASAYQVNMWLSTLDRLDRSTLIVLRERRNLPLLGATRTPVVCIPRTVNFLDFGLPGMRVALYPANVGKNIHLLRTLGVRHVFIGHGDSDKTASFNPFSKVYSEIWVAGPAGRDRYLRASVGVRAEEMVEVGRPQLAGILPAGPAPVGPFLTVLYAPTWEGWTHDPFNTSVVLTGPALVERLLAARPRVRVIYKPHPLTGTVSQAAAAAHQRITALLDRDNAARAADPELAQLAALARPPGPGADVDRWWAAEPAWAARVVTNQGPSLHDCFNVCDLLIADISSVVSDFVASGKPYVVTNLLGLPEKEFRDTYPTAAAGYLLDRDAAQVGAILELVRGSDPLAERRSAHKSYLLGGDETDAMTRFSMAVDAAVRTVTQTWPQGPVQLPVGEG